MNRPMLGVLAAVLCMALSACGGSRTIVKNEESCGKQMTDLQHALDSGAMSQSEYDRAHDEAIRRCNHDY